MYCRNCGQELKAHQDVCLNCGVFVGSGEVYCKNCGQKAHEDFDVCLHCGEKLNAKKELNGYDKTTILLLCIFLGFIGIHNFVMGETWRGVLKIICIFICGISWILTLIDVIKIATNNYVAKPRKCKKA